MTSNKTDLSKQNSDIGVNSPTIKTFIVTDTPDAPTAKHSIEGIAKMRPVGSLPTTPKPQPDKK